MRLSDYPVVFTSDSNYFFSCNAKTIRILSVETGQVVRVLSSSAEEGGHMDTVTSVMINPKNLLQLYSASLDGTIKLWDFNDAVLLRTYEVGVPITHMIIHERIPDCVYLTTKKKSTKHTHQHQAKKYGEYLVLGGRYKLHVIYIAAGNGIEGKSRENDESRFQCYITPERITSLAFHPTEGCIATGDERGRITLWYCFGKNVERPVTTTMHWHAHKVAAMSFTSDGTYLLSGGEESVLVLWQLQTGHKQFLPRLGSEIKHITVSPDQAYYAIGHQDNSVNVIRSVDLKIKSAIQGLKLSHTNHLNNPLLTGLVIEPRNGHVVLNGMPGTLQFYDPIQEQHIMELEVSPRNKVSRTDEKEIIQPQVLQCVFSKDKAARWMVTVDARDDHETTPEQYLKFWEYDDDARTYVLNTRVDAPHTKEITSCVFNPRGGNQAPMVVTTSTDGTFKIWELVHQGEARRGIEAEIAWSCRSTGFYRDMVPRCASFSTDGSILAISYGQIITLWNPYLNTLQGVLTQPPENRPIKHMTFVENSPFLIATTKDHLYSWNLLTCSVWWSYQINVELLQASETNSNFMIICPDPSVFAGSKHRIVVFHPTSPQPLRIESMSKKVRAATFMPDRAALANKSQPKKGSALDAAEPILIMNHGYELEILGGRTAEELRAEADEAAEKARVEALENQKQKSLVTDIFGSSSKAEASQHKSKDRKENDGTAHRGMVSKKNMVRNPLFDAPSHVLAPVTSLYEAFMGQLLLQSKAAKDEAKAKKKKGQDQQNQNQDQNDSQIQDVDMEGEGNASKNEDEEDEDDTTTETQLPNSLVNFFSSRLTL
ncbi:WD repeat-containing protein 75 [Mortierella sp. NVP85]|nr:WD repeat-containing protein 75 [Mortierella sp. NVP85]